MISADLLHQCRRSENADSCGEDIYVAERKSAGMYFPFKSSHLYNTGSDSQGTFYNDYADYSGLYGHSYLSSVPTVSERFRGLSGLSEKGIDATRPSFNAESMFPALTAPTVNSQAASLSSSFATHPLHVPLGSRNTLGSTLSGCTKVQMCLENASLWKRFSSFNTEMIITKTGRRMFPALRVRVQGLDPDTKYVLLVDIMPVDENRYKYHKSQWVVIGKAEPHLNGRVYVHPDSPALGSYWMRRTVSFHKLKLTNNNLQQNGNVTLNSMHRYIPRIHVVETSHLFSLNWSPFCTFSFNESVFTAVTAYQNDKITQLKIENNPFAKSFRHNGKGRRRTGHSKAAIKPLTDDLNICKRPQSDDMKNY